MDELTQLRNENKLLRSITTYRQKKYPKIAFFTNIMLFTSFLFLVVMYEADNTLDSTMPPRVAYILMGALFGFGIMMVVWYKMIFGNPTINQCVLCKRIEINGEYYDFPDLEKVNYKTCGNCATVALPRIYEQVIANHTKDIKDV